MREMDRGQVELTETSEAQEAWREREGAGMER